MSDLRDEYLRYAVRELTWAIEGPEGEFADRATHGQLGAMIAYLADALIERCADAGAVLAQLDELAEAGQPLADWVGDRLADLGVDVDAVISEARA